MTYLPMISHDDINDVLIFTVTYFVMFTMLILFIRLSQNTLYFKKN